MAGPGAPRETEIQVSDQPSGPPLSTPAADASALERVMFEVKRVIVGQERLVERMLVGLLSRGHCLLEGVPGVAKTLAVETLARTVTGSFARLQFTPDLVPSDIVGTRIYRPSTEGFDTELGPIFANFVLADEINRAPAKVQSALLEVMAERQVTIGGVRYPVPSPFLVLATQNPIESEGVYPLPEAQRDRFLMKIVVDYPTAAEEREIVYRMGGEPPVANPVITTDELSRLQVTASRVFVHHAIVDYVVRLVLATRTPAAARHARCRPVGVLRRQPAREPGADRRRPGDRAASRARLRASAGRARRGHRRPAAPHGPVLRRDRRWHPGGSRGATHPADHPAASGRASTASRRVPNPATGKAVPGSALRERASIAGAWGGYALARRGYEMSDAAEANGLPTLDVASAEALLRRLELTVRNKLDGLLQGNYLGWCRVPAARRASRGSTTRATTCAGWTGRSPPARTSRTSGRRSPTVSWRRGWSSTCRRASTSAPR